MTADSYTGAEAAHQRLARSWSLLGRAWSLLFLGAVLAGLAVTFFVATSMRDKDLLRSGEQATAVVVRPIPAGSWNLFDCGRLVVKYQTAQGPQVRQIWLDDTAHLQDPGTRVTVVFDPTDPSRVRTLQDANDPVPWGQPILIAGLLGAVALIVGLRDVVRSTSDRRDARRQADGIPGGLPAVSMASFDVPRTGRDVPAGIPFVPAPGEPAWSHPRTQQTWRQYLKRVLVLGAIAAALTTIAVVANRVVGAGDEDLIAHGDRTTGVIVDGGGYGGKTTQDWVRVRYTVDGAALVGDLHGPSPDELSTGTEVEVYYDAAKPTRFRTVTYANHSNVVDTLGLVWPVVGAGFIGVVALVCAARLLRWRRRFAQSPWQTWHGTPGRFIETRWLDRRWVELSGRSQAGTESTVLLRLAMGFKGSTAMSWSPDGQEVLYLPGPGRSGVILPADTTIPLAVSLPASGRQARSVLRRMSHLTPDAQA